MRTAAKVLRYELSNVIRSRWLLMYTLLFLLLTDALFRFGGSGSRAVLSLMNLVLVLVPLVSLVFGTMYLYQAREFIELLLAQPVGRRELFTGLYAGLSTPLAAGFLVGVGLPILLRGGAAGPLGPLAVLLGAGVVLTFVFTGLAFVTALAFEDRAKGLGLAIVLWLLVAVVYDGFILLVIASFGSYRLETPVLALTIANPVDLARVLLLLQFDIAALMGYTGTVFQHFFGGLAGTVISILALLLWIAVPFLLGLWRFRRKDF